MEVQNKKIRIKDIAVLAGVSEGTVDRVLHNRGEVSDKTRESVNKVLAEINYTPNLFARSLASKKKYHFIAIIPAHNQNDYWGIVEKGFDVAVDEFIHYNVDIEKQYFDQYDNTSFSELLKSILMKDFDGVFMAPVFQEETLKFTKELENRDIPFSFVDSVIEDVEFLTYYGQNSLQSGYIAAKLLLSTLSDKAQILVARTKRKGTSSNQTMNRYKGFMQYINEINSSDKYELINVELNDNDESLNQNLLKKTFEQHKNIKGAITFNSKVYRLAKHFEDININNISLLGYDLLDENIKYLKEGIISFLIAQRPQKQAYFTVRDMCRELIFKQNVDKINYVPIDILMKENIEDYLNFIE
jgi:LacI family transcriptional regulator